MKKNNQTPYALGFFVGAILTFLAACGQKGDNNTAQPVQPVTGYQQCLNCQNLNGSTFFTGESTDYTGSLRVTWSFAGSTMVTQTYPYNNGTVTPGTYYGSVSTTGQMYLSQSMNLGYCVIPAGTYSLMTTQAGQWAYGIVSNLSLQAVGASNLILGFYGQVSSSGYLQNGQVSSSTSNTGRMFGNLVVQSVNGQACQQIIGVQ